MSMWNILCRLWKKAVYINYFYDISVIFSNFIITYIGNLSQVRLNLHRSWPTDRCNWHRLQRLLPTFIQICESTAKKVWKTNFEQRAKNSESKEVGLSCISRVLLVTRPITLYNVLCSIIFDLVILMFDLLYTCTYSKWKMIHYNIDHYFWTKRGGDVIFHVGIFFL